MCDVQIRIFCDTVINSNVKFSAVTAQGCVLEMHPLLQRNTETGRNVSLGVLLLIRLPGSSVSVQRDKLERYSPRAMDAFVTHLLMKASDSQPCVQVMMKYFSDASFTSRVRQKIKFGIK